MDIKQLSNRLQTPPTTLKSWQSRFGIEADKQGRRDHFDEEAVQIFETIKNLRDEGNGLKTIRKRLSNEKLTDKRIEREANENLTVIKRIVNESIQENNGLSEKYAKATYTIGQLEKEVEHLKEQVKLLPSPDNHNRLKWELEQSQQKIESQQSELDTIKSSWWYKLLFKRVL